MALTNAEKQKRWRDRRNALARKAMADARMQACCIFCYLPESDLIQDGHIVINKAGHLVCETCITEAAAAIARAKAKAAPSDK